MTIRYSRHLDIGKHRQSLKDINVYQVKMDEFDKEWINLKNTHSIRYQLSPGDYQFLVKGSNDSITWNKSLILQVDSQIQVISVARKNKWIDPCFFHFEAKPPQRGIVKPS